MNENISKQYIAVMPTYHSICKFPIFNACLTVALLSLFNCHFVSGFSLLRIAQSTEFLAQQAIPVNCLKRLNMGVKYHKTVQYTKRNLTIFLTTVVATWLAELLLCSGDVHPNPGSLSTSSVSSISFSSSSLSNSLLDALKLNHYLSFAHYNVQSIASKLDILQTELLDFDVLAFTETWLHPGITTDDLIESFNNPERENRVDDRHGGVILYVKEAIHYYRRQDLEPRGTECIWIELVNKHKHVLLVYFTDHQTPILTIIR